MTGLTNKRNKILATPNMLQLPTSSQSAVVVVSRHAEQHQQQDYGAFSSLKVMKTVYLSSSFFSHVASLSLGEKSARNFDRI